MDWNFSSDPISIGSSIIGGIFGSSSAKKNLQAQREANQTNLQISRETNQANAALAREQNNWNLAQWHREMDYNTPASQMGRYTSAGINPYMAMNQLTNGNSTSNLQSANLANQTPTSVQAVQGQQPALAFADTALQLYKTLAETGQIDAVTRNTDEDTRGKRIDNDYKPALHESTIDIAKRQIKSLDKDIEFKDIINRYSHDYYDDGSVAQANKAFVQTSLETANFQMRKAFLEIEGQRYQNQISHYLAMQEGFNAERQPIVLAHQLGLISAQINSLNENVGIGWYNAKSGRMQANAALSQARTAELNGQSQRALNAAQIKYTGSLIELNKEQRRLLAKNIVEIEARTNGLKLSNRQLEMYTDALEVNLPYYIDAQKWTFKGQVGQGKINSSVERQVMLDLAQFCSQMGSAYQSYFGTNMNAGLRLLGK